MTSRSPRTPVPTDLLSHEALEQSGVVANCRMNRERVLTGTNGYSVELGFNPLDVIRRHVQASGHSAWLDLCCGSGRALIEAAEAVHAEGLDDRVEIVGVDLVGMFAKCRSELQCLRRIEASLTNWSPDCKFDLITCVHGLHYIGDKLGLITRVAAWLTSSGIFTGNISLDENIHFRSTPPPGSRAAVLRKNGLLYDGGRKRLHCVGSKQIQIPVRYLGADDQSGPNYTGQAAVNSFYEWLG